MTFINNYIQSLQETNYSNITAAFINNYIQPSQETNYSNITTGNQSQQLFILALAQKVIDAIEADNTITVENIASSMGDIATPETVIYLLNKLATQEKQEEVVQAISNLSFDANLSLDGTGLATAVNQQEFLGKIGGISTEDTVMFFLKEILNRLDSLVSFVNNLSGQDPIHLKTKTLTHAVFKDIDNDGLDDISQSPASVTIPGGKKFLSWFIRGGHPVIDGVIWHPQEEKNISTGFGEVLDSISINYTGSEVLISYY